MQDIEPFFRWRDQYVASEDPHSPFFKRQYNEFEYTNTIYNYYIHPQWDEFDSSTLYLKILFVDYTEQYAIIELIGEWNDAIQNDIMYLKRNVIEKLLKFEIKYFILLMDNVYNFHSSDDCYYEEWQEELTEEGGWIAMLGTLEHVEEEMVQAGLQHYIHLGRNFNAIEWRRLEPVGVFAIVEKTLHTQSRRLRY